MTDGTRPLALKLFEALVREHHKRILAFASSLCHDQAEAEDLAQEAFIVAYEKLSEFDPERDFGNWVRGIIRLKYLEAARRKREVPLDNVVMERLEQEHARWDAKKFDAGVDVFAHLQDCLGKLDADSRNLVDRFYRQQHKSEVIASDTGLQPVTVRKRLERIRRDLRSCIEAAAK